MLHYHKKRSGVDKGKMDRLSSIHYQCHRIDELHQLAYRQKLSWLVNLPMMKTGAIPNRPTSNLELTKLLKATARRRRAEKRNWRTLVHSRRRNVTVKNLVRRGWPKKDLFQYTMLTNASDYLSQQDIGSWTTTWRKFSSDGLTPHHGS
jgi:hypothetical protein